MTFRILLTVITTTFLKIWFMLIICYKEISRSKTNSLEGVVFKNTLVL